MKKNQTEKSGILKKIAIAFIRVCGYFLFVFLTFFFIFEFISTEKMSEQKSPNGKYVIEEIRSYSEGGHAPYGTELVLSPVFWREKNHVILAGYFNGDLSYQWIDDKKILVKYKSRSDERTIFTKTESVRGITIEYEDMGKIEEDLKESNEKTK